MQRTILLGLAVLVANACISSTDGAPDGGGGGGSHHDATNVGADVDELRDFGAVIDASHERDGAVSQTPDVETVDAGCDPTAYEGSFEVVACGQNGPMAVCRVGARTAWLTYGGRLFVDGAEVFHRPGSTFHSPQCTSSRLVWIESNLNQVLSFEGTSVRVLARDTTSVIHGVYATDDSIAWSTSSGVVYVQNAQGVRTATVADARVSRVATATGTTAWMVLHRGRDITIVSQFGAATTSTVVYQRDLNRIDPGPLLIDASGAVVAVVTHCSESQACIRAPEPSCCSSSIVRLQGRDVSIVSIPHAGAVYGMTVSGNDFVLSMPMRLLAWRGGAQFETLFEHVASTPRFATVTSPFLYVADPRISGDAIRENGLILRRPWP